MNWTVQELVDAFTTARLQGLELARKAGKEREADEQRPRKRRKFGGPETNAPPPRQTRQLRSSGRRTNGAAPSQETMILDSEDDDIEEYHPDPEVDPGPTEPEDGLVACPMCQRRMKEGLVFAHLDRCDADNDNGPVVSESRSIHNSLSNRN